MRKDLVPGTWRFVKSLIAGGVATIADLATLTLLVELVHFSPAHASVPALLVGALVQFGGARGFVFGAAQGSLKKQVTGFVLVELGTFALNAATFYLAITYTPVPYPVVRLLCQFAVYVGFSYPLWIKVFAVKSEAASAPTPLSGSESA